MEKISAAQITRHLLMRISLGVTLGWFGFLQVRAPGEWLDFVPAIVSQVSPFPDTSLILIHGLLLILAAVGITFGLYFLAASWLGVFLLVDIIVALIFDHGPINLIVRDIGILGLAIGLGFENVRFWQLDNAVPRFGLRKMAGTYSSPSTQT